MARKRLGRRERALVKVAEAKRLAHGETTTPAAGFFRSQWHGMAKGSALVQKRGDKLFDGRRNPEREARAVEAYDPGFVPDCGWRPRPTSMRLALNTGGNPGALPRKR